MSSPTPEEFAGQPKEISPAASAALTRAIDAQQVEVHTSGDVGRIEFTDESFQAWYLAELAAHDATVRDRLLEEACFELERFHASVRAFDGNLAQVAEFMSLSPTRRRVYAGMLGRLKAAIRVEIATEIEAAGKKIGREPHCIMPGLWKQWERAAEIARGEA